VPRELAAHRSAHRTERNWKNPRAVVCLGRTTHPHHFAHTGLSIVYCGIRRARLPPRPHTKRPLSTYSFTRHGRAAAANAKIHPTGWLGMLDALQCLLQYNAMQCNPYLSLSHAERKKESKRGDSARSSISVSVSISIGTIQSVSDMQGV
jgi:hypothetical protein